MKVRLPLGESRWERELTGTLERALDLLNQYAQVPAGGLSGQVLSKGTDRDYDLAWRTIRSGTVTLVGGTATVTLSPAEADANYQVLLSSSAAGETMRWGSKAAGSFVINSSNGSSTAAVDWVLIR